MAIIELPRGYEAIVDDEDYARLKIFTWHLFVPRRSKYVYAARKSNRSEQRADHRVFLHHQVLNIMPWELNGKVVDHIDRDSLNCRKENLRLVSSSVNLRNSDRSSKAKWVYYVSSRGYWRAYTNFPGQPVKHLGSRATEAEALALVTAAKEKHYEE